MVPISGAHIPPPLPVAPRTPPSEKIKISETSTKFSVSPFSHQRTGKWVSIPTEPHAWKRRENTLQKKETPRKENTSKAKKQGKDRVGEK